MQIAVPVNDKLDLITSLATTTDYEAWQGTYLHHKNSDMAFDLTYINPYSEDWTEVKRTNFADIYQAVGLNTEE